MNEYAGNDLARELTGDGEAAEAVVMSDLPEVETRRLWFGGLDRSGSLNMTDTVKGNDFFVVAIAIISLESNDFTPIEKGLNELRLKFSKPIWEEFHAHKMSEAMIWEMLLLARTHDLRIGAVIVDRTATRREHLPGVPLPTQVQLHYETTRYLLSEFLSRNRVQTLWCDEDVKGRRNVERFATEIKRIHRERWSGNAVDIRQRPSHESSLIQLADIVAYTLAQSAKDHIRTPGLRQLVAGMKRDERNVILGPMSWGISPENEG